MKVCGHWDLKSDARWALSHSNPSIILSVACMWQTQGENTFLPAYLKMRMPGRGDGDVRASTWGRRQQVHRHGGAFTFLPSVHKILFTEMLAIILFDFSDALWLVCLRLMRH